MKKILIFVCLLFLTGCSVNYEITLKDNKIKERLTIIETDQSLFDVRNDAGWTLRESIEILLDEEDEFSVQDYSVKSLNSDTQLGLEYSSNSSTTLINSSAINQCYTNPTIEFNGDIVTFNSGNDFKCYEYYDNLDTISVVLKTDYEVISSNAESIDDNKYMWNITKDGNKEIEISYKQNTSKKALGTTIMFIAGLILIALVITYYIYSKFKSENKI